MGWSQCVYMDLWGGVPEVSRLRRTNHLRGSVHGIKVVEEEILPRADTSILTRFSNGPEESNERARSVVFPPALNLASQ
jgi:hypothetical protein